MAENLRLREETAAWLTIWFSASPESTGVNSLVQVVRGPTRCRSGRTCCSSSACTRRGSGHATTDSFPSPVPWGMRSRHMPTCLHSVHVAWMFLFDVSPISSLQTLDKKMTECAHCPGSQILVTTPDGRQVSVAVPAGVAPGQLFQVQVRPLELWSLHVISKPIWALLLEKKPWTWSKLRHRRIRDRPMNRWTDGPKFVY